MTSTINLIAQAKSIVKNVQPETMFVVVSCINFLNFLDRGIIPGASNEFIVFVQGNIETDKPDVYIGLLQSSFIVGFSAASLVFGHLVHYYSPFYLCGVGMSIWICAVLLCCASYYVDR